MSGSNASVPGEAEPHIYPSGDGLCVGVRVSPSARRTALRGLHADRLKVAVAAPPEDNRANRELEQALAGWLGLKRDQVSVAKGHASRDKVVAFTGTEEARLRALIASALEKCLVDREDGPVGS